MSEPFPDALFDALIAQAGLELTPEERESIRGASRHIATSIARLREPLPIELEPATIFVPGEPTR